MNKIYILEDLDCAHCAAKIEEAAAKIGGVLSSNCTLLTQKLTLELEDGTDVAAVTKELKSITKKTLPDVTVVEA